MKSAANFAITRGGITVEHEYFGCDTTIRGGWSTRTWWWESEGCCCPSSFAEDMGSALAKKAFRTSGEAKSHEMKVTAEVLSVKGSVVSCPSGLP